MSSARHSTAQRTPAAHARARRARPAPVPFAGAALALALTACATDDPTFCSPTRPCPQGQRCDLPNRTCVGPADRGQSEGGQSDGQEDLPWAEAALARLRHVIVPCPRPLLGARNFLALRTENGARWRCSTTPRQGCSWR